MKKLIATTILALTLNSAINSTAHAHDSEVFGLGGIVVDNQLMGSRLNVGYSSFFDNNSYYKVEGSYSSFNKKVTKGTEGKDEITPLDDADVITKFDVVIGVGYNTGFYYSPEVKFIVGANLSKKIFRGGLSFSPLSFKFPLTDNLSWLLSAFTIDLGFENAIVAEIGLFKSGLSYKL